MELRDFIKTTLTDIAFGIIDAQNTEGVGGLIAPDGIGGHTFPPDSGVVHESRITSTVVKFDVAVTAEQSKTGEAGASLRIAVVEAKLGGQIEGKDTRVSRIQFSVPLVMPQNPRDWSTKSGTAGSA